MRIQNVYDNAAFFAGYKDLRQNDTGLNGALEVPALHAQLPDLSGLTILDLGSGFGDFARYAPSRRTVRHGAGYLGEDDRRSNPPDVG